MAKAAELRVEIDPELLERLRKEAKRIGVRLSSLVDLALIHFLERADGAAALRHEIQDALAGQAIVNAKIEHLAEFVAAVVSQEHAPTERTRAPTKPSEA
jgi:hypothetical protein